MNFLDMSEDIVDYIHDDYLVQDIDKWALRLRLSDELSTMDKFVICFSQRQEYRSVFNYRAKIFGNHKLSEYISRNLQNKKNGLVNNLYISCKDIAPGFYIEHGFSTIIYARKIGNNFHVNQNVTIGSGRGGIPTIGNNVKVFCNSVVVGGILLGNDSCVGAGSVVVDSVPDNCTVASPKAVIISRG